MEFSKDSWHFHFAKKYGGLRTWEKEPYHTSLCEYATYVGMGLLSFVLLSTLVTFTAIFGIGGFIALLSYGPNVWHAFGPFFVSSALIICVALAFSVAGFLGWFSSRHDRRMNKAWMDYVESNPDADYWSWRNDYDKKREKRPSIVMEWFKAKKEKVCPIIKIT